MKTKFPLPKRNQCALYDVPNFNGPDSVQIDRLNDTEKGLEGVWYGIENQTQGVTLNPRKRPEMLAWLERKQAKFFSMVDLPIDD